MTRSIKYLINSASEKEISDHLNVCSDNFIPSLATYVNIKEYAKKIFLKSTRFEAFYNNNLIGLIAIYLDSNTKSAFITNISVDKEFFGKKISLKLLKNCKYYLIKQKYNEIKLDVNKKNSRAIAFYKKNEFAIQTSDKNNFIMTLKLDRDYNKELNDTKGHKYAYNFDFDIMHPFMLKAFLPFFKPSSLLELGSFKGEFTKRFLPYFDDITCVEASDNAIEIAKKELGNQVNFINSLFETAKLSAKYDNIVMTHVLEHLDNPIKVLRRINDEWLSENGRFFLVCPNANAPSRQIAVKMGLISHNAAVTAAEEAHGHRITYSLDTLERDVKAAGLNVIHRSGIFFKALANFQWDQLLNTDIISKEYLEGCFQLGQQYPDLCSSIFLLCEKGR